MSGRDDLLDLAAQLVAGQVEESALLADVIVSLSVDELRLLVGLVSTGRADAAASEGGVRVQAEVLVARGRDLVVKCPWCAAHHRHLRGHSRSGWQNRTPPCGRALSAEQRAAGYWFLDDGRS
ncbi:hypothetical protein GCM10027519_07650 [Kineococcus endophyticus]